MRADKSHIGGAPEGPWVNLAPPCDQKTAVEKDKRPARPKQEENKKGRVKDVAGVGDQHPNGRRSGESKQVSEKCSGTSCKKHSTHGGDSRLAVCKMHVCFWLVGDQDVMGNRTKTTSRHRESAAENGRDLVTRYR